MRNLLVRFREIVAPLLHFMRNWLILFKKNIPRLLSARGKKLLKKGMLVFTGTMLILVVMFFALRNVVLNSMANNKIASYLGHRQGAVLSMDAARFSGLDRIVFTNIRMCSASKTIAMNLNSGAVRLSFWNMLFGRVRLTHLELDGLELDLLQDSAPPSVPARPSIATAPAGRGLEGGADYADRAAGLLDLFFMRIPGTFRISRLTIHSELDHVRQTFHIPQLAIDGPAFATTVEIDDLEKKRSYYLTGNIRRGKKQLAIHLLPLRRGAVAPLPFIDRQWGLRVSFDSVTIGLESRGSRHGVLGLDGSLAVGGLTINHPRIAAGDVILENASLDYVLNIGADYFELDRATLVRFNKLLFHPYIMIKTRPTRQLTMKLDKTWFEADDLFSSLPAGLFTRLAGIQTSGQIAYEFDFFVDFSRPEQLTLQANLEKSAFRINRFGRVDFRDVNEPFVYTAYEKDRALRSFVVGPENADFRSLDQFPSCLKDAVMISEDGAFFGHRGFLLGPIKDSIAANIKEKRFVRGASTISMQLVKNLYLKRQKTIARKFEEMLITWLIEDNRLISKERMYEIYLNIIEWGPLVYGATEAARFYFDKDVEKLTLAEAIFMASIIPRPKRFMAFFDGDQRLRPWLQAYYDDVSYKMLKRGMISQEDYFTLVPEIRLKGPARFLLKGNEELPADEPWSAEESGE
jgi:hypothetical protein